MLQLDNQSRNELPGEVVSMPSLREVQVECRHEFMEIQEPKVPLVLWWSTLAAPQNHLGELFLKFYLFIYLFIFGCVGSSFLCQGFL